MAQRKVVEIRNNLPKKQPKDKMVSIKLPKARKNEDNFIMVSVNTKNYRIMKGVNVKVPASVAEVIRTSEKAKDRAERYIEKTLEDRQNKI